MSEKMPEADSRPLLGHKPVARSRVRITGILGFLVAVSLLCNFYYRFHEEITTTVCKRTSEDDDTAKEWSWEDVGNS